MLLARNFLKKFMNLSVSQKRIIERVVNVFETGTTDGDYGAISIYSDGPHDIRQITYGRSQTTEYGNLRKLVTRYSKAGGVYSEPLAAYADLVGSTPLTDNSVFKQLLRKSGRDDPVMQQTQDKFFDDQYFNPAKLWCESEGFATALAMLVAYDSFIHSGRMLWVIRSMFPDLTPAKGGDERLWVTAYVRARNKWLTNHHREAVRASAYRTRDLLREVSRSNWDLSQLPIKANGVNVN